MTKVSRFKIGLLLCLSPSITFAANPPKNFLQLEACGYIADGLCTLDELASIGFKGSDLKWVDGEDGTWILRVVKVDKLTRQKSDFSISFEKSKDADGREIAYPRKASTQAKNAFGQETVVVGEALPHLHAIIVAVAEKVSRKDLVKEKKREEASAASKKASEADSPQKTDLLSRIQGTYIGVGPSQGKFAGKDNELHISKVTNTGAQFSLYCFEKDKINHRENKTLSLRYIAANGYMADSVEGKFSEGDCKFTVQFTRTKLGPPSADAVMHQGRNCCASLHNDEGGDFFSHRN